MNMRLVGIGGVVVLAIGSLEGCGAPDSATLGGIDEGVGKTSAALTSSPFTLRNFASGLCLDVSGGGPALSTQVIQWPCNGGANQRWTKGAPSNDPAYFHLISGVADNRCLSTYYANSTTYYGVDDFVCTTTYSGFKPIFVSYDESGHECDRFDSDLVHTWVLGTSGNRSQGAKVVISADFNNIAQHPDQLWCVY